MATTPENFLAHAHLTQRRNQFPQLQEAEQQAHLHLVAAMLALDEADDRVEAGHTFHSLDQQVEVEAAKERYTHALANLVRGQEADGTG